MRVVIASMNDVLLFGPLLRATTLKCQLGSISLPRLDLGSLPFVLTLGFHFEFVSTVLCAMTDRCPLITKFNCFDAPVAVSRESVFYYR